jgi:hypothetical protein
MSSNTFETPPIPDEAFEDVKLNEEVKQQQQPKKKSFLSRFGDSSGEPTSKDDKHHFHLLSGRKRGQSGKGEELGDIPRPQSNGNGEVVIR